MSKSNAPYASGGEKYVRSVDGPVAAAALLAVPSFRRQLWCGAVDQVPGQPAPSSAVQLWSVRLMISFSPAQLSSRRNLRETFPASPCFRVRHSQITAHLSSYRHGDRGRIAFSRWR
jgi:hypothetical protein